MVISKSLPEDKESKRVLWALKSRGFNVHFAHPQLERQVSDQMFHNPAILSYWTYLLGNDSTTIGRTDPDNKQDFSQPITPSSEAKTCVFWDLVECPFPNDLDPETIFQRIKSTLEENGYRGGISIWAYAEKIPFSDDVLDKYQKARIYFVPEVPGDKIARFLRMSHDIRLWEMDTYPVFGVETNVIVISNDINTQGKYINFSHYLIGMQGRYYSAFLVQPKCIDPESSDWPRSLFDRRFSVGPTRCGPFNKRWRKKVKKQKAVEVPKVSPVEIMNNQQLSPVDTIKNLDFSKPLPPVSGPRVGVFWDIKDFPFPNDLDPELLYKRFELLLDAKDYYGEMSIWAYAEKIPFSDDVLDKFQKAKIYFLPKVPGNKIERVQMMVNDMFLWKIDTPCKYVVPPSVIVISNEIQGCVNLTLGLTCMHARLVNAFLVEPKKLTTDDHKSLAVWPGRLFDEGVIIHKFLYPSASPPKLRKKQKVISDSED
ncbi:unnamed protein product [Arabidopsis arenosa]|uniref:NYN domain-containing protein n=1 Tax=Arabidopsis arenosa TaxID=38785 RepID=A0A8S2AE54_ARAAE|nr:unnamed protein product [Arabidopsis arenosa]